MSKLHYIQFYPADWIQDTQVLTLFGQGAWIKIICALHTSATYGRREWTRPELMVFLGIQYDEQLTDVLVEIDRVADMDCRDVDGNAIRSLSEAYFITIICRRMVRDLDKINSRKEKYKRYNHRRTTNQPPKNHLQNLETKKLETRILRDSFKKKSQDLRASPGPSQAKKKEGRKEGNGKAGLDESIKLWADAIYETDPVKFGRLVQWIKAAERTYSDSVVASALQRFLPHAAEVGEWWGYLDRILDKEEGKANGSESEAGSEWHKREEREWLKTR